MKENLLDENLPPKSPTIQFDTTLNQSFAQFSFYVSLFLHWVY